MKRLMLLAAGVALAAVPAVIGLIGNPALSHSVPVRVPAGAVPVTAAQIHDSGADRHGKDVSGKDAPGKEPGKDGRGIADDSGKDPGAVAPDVPGEDRHDSTATSNAPRRHRRGSGQVMPF
jgi:hypothetical protein